MISLRVSGILAVMLFATSTASAQVTPVGPFVGTLSEGFENALVGGMTHCVEPIVFSNMGSLCSTGNQGAVVAASAASSCSILAHSGLYFTLSTSGYYTYTFAQDVAKFGGYFASHTVWSDATLKFYDVNNALIGTVTASIPANCSWNWHGWQSIGPAIRKVEVIGPSPFNGPFVLMDDMEIVISGPCEPSVITYCTAQLSSSGCTAVMSSTGTPSLGNPLGFQVTTSNLEMGRDCLMFFGTTGPNALPFSGGTLCLWTPLYRMPLSNSGGATVCSGSLSRTLADFLAHPLGGPLIQSFVQVNAQVFTYDPQSAFGRNWSGGIQFRVCP